MIRKTALALVLVASSGLAVAQMTPEQVQARLDALNARKATTTQPSTRPATRPASVTRPVTKAPRPTGGVRIIRPGPSPYHLSPTTRPPTEHELAIGAAFEKLTEHSIGMKWSDALDLMKVLTWEPQMVEQTAGWSTYRHGNPWSSEWTVNEKTGRIIAFRRT